MQSCGECLCSQVREMKYQLRVEASVLVIQSYYRGWRVRRYFRVEQAAITIQKYFRYCVHVRNYGRAISIIHCKCKDV